MQQQPPPGVLASTTGRRRQAGEAYEMNKKHGASGLERRIEQNLPLAADDKQRRDEIIAQLGYEVLPSGALGFLIEAVADNVLLAERFRGARNWAAERGDIERFEQLAQRSGWRNDKAIGQLLTMVKLQKEDSAPLDYEALLNEQR